MYIDGVIIFSLVVVAMMIYMMIYLGKYAKRHIDMDEEMAQQLDKENKEVFLDKKV